MKTNENQEALATLRQHFVKAFEGKKASEIKVEDIQNALNTFHQNNPKGAGDVQTTQELANEQSKGGLLAVYKMLPLLAENGVEHIIDQVVNASASGLPGSIVNTRVILFPSDSELKSQQESVGNTNDRTLKETPEKYHVLYNSIHPILLSMPDKLKSITEKLDGAPKNGYSAAKFVEETSKITYKELQRVVNYANSPWGKSYAAQGEKQEHIHKNLLSLQKDIGIFSKKIVIIKEKLKHLASSKDRKIGKLFPDLGINFINKEDNLKLKNKKKLFNLGQSQLDLRDSLQNTQYGNIEKNPEKKAPKKHSNKTLTQTEQRNHPIPTFTQKTQETIESNTTKDPEKPMRKVPKFPSKIPPTQNLSNPVPKQYMQDKTQNVTQQPLTPRVNNKDVPLTYSVQKNTNKVSMPNNNQETQKKRELQFPKNRIQHTPTITEVQINPVKSKDIIKKPLPKRTDTHQGQDDTLTPSKTPPSKELPTPTKKELPKKHLVPKKTFGPHSEKVVNTLPTKGGFDRTDN